MSERDEDITLEEVKKRRHIVEDSIYALLCDFESKTQCVITHIHIDRVSMDVSDSKGPVQMLSGISIDVVIT